MKKNESFKSETKITALRDSWNDKVDLKYDRNCIKKK